MTNESMMGNDGLNKEVIQWSCHYLSTHRYTLKSTTPEVVQNTPWSYVVRFASTDGYIYLKHTPKLLALEADIIQILHAQFHVSVPHIIAHNPELNCFLMKDAGKSLRVLLKQQFDIRLFCQAIENFTSMQISVADHVKVFLNIGVPDWRLDKLPDLYIQLLSQRETLLADGLSKKEIETLEKLLPRVSELCQILSEFAIKPSIVQPDFNDNNTLVDSANNLTIIDLGEVAISHPFFSLINVLQQAKKHHGLTETDAQYQQLMDACLNNYLQFESKSSLLKAFAQARLLFFIYGALANYRLMMACDKTRFTSSFKLQGKPSVPLKEFMKACSTSSKSEWKAKKELKRAKQRVTNLLRAKEMHAARLNDRITNSSKPENLNKVMIGCSGWFYWHWRGKFYPSTLTTSKWFKHYMRSFDTVELNAPFYNWPSVNIVKSWLRQAGNRKFCYTIKASELITHIKRFKSTKKIVADFNYIADLLGEHMGCFLYQMPPSYSYTKVRLDNLLSQLDSRRRNVVEFRHKSWWNQTVFAAFRKHKIIFCSVSSPTMPDVLVKTTDEVYVRFHGSKKLYSHNYTKEELMTWLKRIKESKPKRIWAYFNNDREAFAIKNAKWFKKQLR